MRPENVGYASRRGHSVRIAIRKSQQFPALGSAATEAAGRRNSRSKEEVQLRFVKRHHFVGDLFCLCLSFAGYYLYK